MQLWGHVRRSAPLRGAGAPSTRPRGRIFGRSGAAKRPHFFKVFFAPAGAGTGALIVRVFELTTRITGISRSDDRTATAAAAYRACCVIECEREGRTHDYSRKHGREAGEIALPEGSPVWARDRGRLWNGAELVEKNGKRGKNAGKFKADAKTARDVMFTYPSELSAAGRLKAARIIARYLVSTSAVAVDFNIHQPGKDGDERNHHCHMMFSTRRMTAKGFGQKAREWDDLKTGPKLSKALRKFIADTLNAELAAEGKADLVKVEYLSFEARGSSQKPVQQHQGPGKTHALRKKQAQARKAWETRERKEQRERHAKERASLKLRQDFALQRKLAEIEQRGKEGRAAIRRGLEEARKADIPATGPRHLFLIATGRDMREAFDRQARETLRIEEADRQRADLKEALKAERNEFVRGQVEERDRLADRHKGEDTQLQQAFEHRKALDRTAEVHARSNEARSNSREQQQDREQGRGRSISPDDLTPP
jgi:MobA/MobL family